MMNKGALFHKYDLTGDPAAGTPINPTGVKATVLVFYRKGADKYVLIASFMLTAPCFDLLLAE